MIESRLVLYSYSWNVLSDLESHLATLGAMPELAQTSDYLGALSLANRPLQVVLSSIELWCSAWPLLFCSSDLTGYIALLLCAQDAPRWLAIYIACNGALQFRQYNDSFWAMHCDI